MLWKLSQRPQWNHLNDFSVTVESDAFISHTTSAPPVFNCQFSDVYCSFSSGFTHST